MPTYKLTYFNGRGRGETIRLLFAAGGIKYEDVRIEGAQWPALKPNTPFGHLPILEVDGVTLSESATIARFVAKMAGRSKKKTCLYNYANRSSLLRRLL
ncbi:hematopoietic prostaglandin D synthase-like [Branchiostoma floridae x Branchiostoma belcheri]